MSLTKSMERIRVAIVDDHQPFRQGIQRILAKNNDVEVVLEAVTGQDFINQMAFIIPEKFPQLILLDSRMPEMDGVETVGWIKKEKPDMKILIFSLFDSSELVLKMLALGVNGYITKTSDPAELNEAIAKIMSRGFYYSPFIAEKVVESMHNNYLQIKPGSTDADQLEEKLTERETVFLIHACAGLKTPEIAEKMSITTRTVEVYKANIFKKLKVNNSVNMVLKALKLGLTDLHSSADHS